MEFGRVTPDFAPDFLPVLDDFGSLDLHIIARCRLINDAPCVGLPATRRINTFAVNARMDGDRISRLGEIGRMLDGTEGGYLRTGIRVAAGQSDMVFRGVERAGKGESVLFHVEMLDMIGMSCS